MKRTKRTSIKQLNDYCILYAKRIIIKNGYQVGVMSE